MSKHISFALFPVTQVTQTIAFPIPFAQLSYGFTSSPPMQQSRQYSSFLQSLHLSTLIPFSSIQFNSTNFNLISSMDVPWLLYNTCSTQRPPLRRNIRPFPNNSNPNSILQIIYCIIQVTSDISSHPMCCAAVLYSLQASWPQHHIQADTVTCISWRA